MREKQDKFGRADKKEGKEERIKGKIKINGQIWDRRRGEGEERKEEE